MGNDFPQEAPAHPLSALGAPTLDLFHYIPDATRSKLSLGTGGSVIRHYESVVSRDLPPP